MLGKLIKYDFKATSHSMLPIYLATVVLTAVFSLMIKLGIEDGFIFMVFTFLFITALFGSMFATVFFTVSRFNIETETDDGPDRTYNKQYRMVNK